MWEEVSVWWGEVAMASAEGSLNLPWQICCICCIRSFFLAPFICLKRLTALVLHWITNMSEINVVVGKKQMTIKTAKTLSVLSSSLFTLPANKSVIHFCITRYNSEIIAGTSSGFQGCKALSLITRITDPALSQWSQFIYISIIYSMIKKFVGYMSLT